MLSKLLSLNIALGFLVLFFFYLVAFFSFIASLLLIYFAVYIKALISKA
jgi:hypothetical protein